MVRHTTHKRLAGALRFALPAVLVTGLLAGGGMVLPRMEAQAAEDAVVIPAPLVDEKGGGAKSETAVFAGGCFWGVQGVFQHVKGVSAAVSGYAGGPADAASYESVSTGETGHAESVKITYDPSEVTYGQLLQIYFSVAHDPTELNRQGPDSGTQYRSAIFPATPEQKTIAESYIGQLGKAGLYGKPIVTKVEDAAFYPAENYHQDFLAQNPTYPYIVVNDLPKVQNLKTVFPALYRETPVLVAGAKS